jgi:hypothetical protein
VSQYQKRRLIRREPPVMNCESKMIINWQTSGSRSNRIVCSKKGYNRLSFGKKNCKSKVKISIKKLNWWYLGVANPNWSLGRNLENLPKIWTFWAEIWQKTGKIHPKHWKIADSRFEFGPHAARGAWVGHIWSRK